MDPYRAVARRSFQIAIRIGCLLSAGLAVSISHGYISYSNPTGAASGGGHHSESSTSITLSAPRGGHAEGDVAIQFINGFPSVLYFSMSVPGNEFFSMRIFGDVNPPARTCGGCGDLAPPKGTFSDKLSIRGSNVYLSSTLDTRIGENASTNLQVSWEGTVDYPEEEEESEEAAEPVPVGGAYLTTPVVAEHGFSDFLYARSNRAPNESPTLGSPTYEFASEIPFTHFLIPQALPNGDSVFQVEFAGQTHELFAGVPFAFTDYLPSGTSQFYLNGFDSSEMLDIRAPAPFLHAFRFLNEGLNRISNIAVPEPATVGIVATALLCIPRRFAARRQPIGEVQLM